MSATPDHLARARNVLATAEGAAENEGMLQARGIPAGAIQDRCAALATAHALVDIAASLRRLAPGPGASFFDVVFDGPPGPDAPRFVEVEDAEGRGLNVGEWVKRSDLTWALRIGRP